MSTSPSPSRVEAGDTPAPETETREFSAFPYRDIPVRERRLAGGTAGHASFFDPDSEGPDDAAARLTDAREHGRQDGLAEARRGFDEQVARERAVVANAVAEFARERDAYYQKIEAEVVHLALSIAGKILHREAQVDPLLVAGLVRVALEKIEGATGVVLLVNPQNASDWRGYLALHLEPGAMPEVMEDPAIEPNSCLLRTSMGTAKIGLEVQLKEIEQGLMDLLAAKPGDKR